MVKNHFTEALDRIKPLVWEVVQRYLPHREPRGHYEMVREYPFRQGKYLRPALLVLEAELFGAKEKDALPAAAAMQLSEEWLLAHDDMEDHSEVRRATPGALNPTLNVVYGDELAVNAGDTLQILMWRALYDAARELGDPRGALVFQKMNDVLLTTTEGQYMELAWIRDGVVSPTEQMYYDMATRKAAMYTVTGPLQLGAMIAGASEEAIADIETWGKPLGIAFQIRDDVLNVTEENGVAGKELGGDVLEGKRTLLLIHLLAACAPIEREYLTALYRRPRKKKTARDAEYVIHLMERYGSIAHACAVADRFAEQAKTAFARAMRGYKTSTVRRALHDAIIFMVTRTR